MSQGQIFQAPLIPEWKCWHGNMGSSVQMQALPLSNEWLSLGAEASLKNTFLLWHYDYYY